MIEARKFGCGVFVRGCGTIKRARLRKWGQEIARSGLLTMRLSETGLVSLEVNVQASGVGTEAAKDRIVGVASSSTNDLVVRTARSPGAI